MYVQQFSQIEIELNNHRKRFKGELWKILHITFTAVKELVVAMLCLHNTCMQRMSAHGPCQNHDL